MTLFGLPALDRSGFGLAAWAMPFLFDFTFNGFDLLPDIVGYGLLYMAADRLEGSYPAAQRARTGAGLLLPFGLLALLAIRLPAGWELAFALPTLAFQAYVVGALCEVVVTAGQDSPGSTLGRDARMRFAFFLAVQAMLLAVMLSYGYVGGMVGALAAVFALAVYALLWDLFRRAGRLTRNAPSPAPEAVYVP